MLKESSAGSVERQEVIKDLDIEPVINKKKTPNSRSTAVLNKDIESVSLQAVSKPTPDATKQNLAMEGTRT